ncbi:low affinity iron permease family protein [Ginsengibacter hankyongi]|uniref:Low affinity iron permease family protein n=1 Tax=Ginsengibacter hankyongi TaxID=2607284 RepID=A0A5J5IDG2_9BACT|nr:low affinity iron permease family protein [Ginsengibacter hankyongi]KAA9037176.1 low affinity iron permease family protein [Ginsengibacter hankyongi]
MNIKTGEHKKYSFEKFASSVTKATGGTPAFMVAFFIILIWGAAGPFFHYSQTWQAIISTGTTITTFLMVFLIQKSQNKDSLAIQLKLNELVAANEFASNRLLNVEKMTEDELKVIHKYYSKLSEFTRNDETMIQSHSIDEVSVLHDFKNEMEQELKDAV